MKRALGTFLLAVGVAGFALAGTPAVPEVDPGSFASVLALISGTLLVVRGRWRN
jgi:hypothetical protein